MDTQVRTPQAIFMQPQRLLVPLFQRPYVWSEERQWDPLWRDVARVATRFLESPHNFNQPHFLGAIVLQQTPSKTSDLQQRTVIDGQQRLTTLQILLDAIHAEIAKVGMKIPAARLEPLIENAEAFCKMPEDRFKVWPTNRDREAFNEVMEAPSPINYDALINRNHRLIKAHRYFAEQCNEWLAEKGEEHIAARAEALERTVRELLQLVVIDLTANEDAQEIFETLNARGTPLTAADLIKNFVFQRLLEKGADVELAYASYWEQFETAFWEKQVNIGRTLYPRSAVFLNHWLISQTGEEIVAREVFSRFKTYVDYDAQKSIADLLKDIHRAMQIYRKFIEDSELSEGPLDRMALFGYRTRTMESEVVKPVVLALLDHKGGKPPGSEIDSVLNTIESWLTRRMLVKATTKSNNTILTEVVNVIRRGAISELGKAVQDYFASQHSESSYWPDDEEVRNTLLTLPVYRKLSRSRLRIVLEAYEDYLRAWNTEKGSYAGVRIKRSSYAIEHLMPQSWLRHWELTLNITEDEREKRIHRLGNLTLVSKRLNSKVSNGPWVGKEGKEGKVKSLLDNDVLLMNSALVSNYSSGWTESEIDLRSKQIVDVLLKIWPVPEGHKTIVRGKEKASSSYVEVADLIAEGLLSPGQILYSRHGKYRGHTATVLSDGRLDYEGSVFDSPSAAGIAVLKRATNGWWLWCLDEHGTKALTHVRNEYRERMALESDAEDEEDEEGEEDESIS